MKQPDSFNREIFIVFYRYAIIFHGVRDGMLEVTFKGKMRRYQQKPLTYSKLVTNYITSSCIQHNIQNYKINTSRTPNGIHFKVCEGIT
jgi:hypothetical protein